MLRNDVNRRRKDTNPARMARQVSNSAMRTAVAIATLLFSLVATDNPAHAAWGFPAQPIPTGRLAGRIIDAETGEALSNARVTLTSGDGSTSSQTRTVVSGSTFPLAPTACQSPGLGSHGPTLAHAASAIRGASSRSLRERSSTGSRSGSRGALRSPAVCSILEASP
jgi:hypothetical protein